jgi:selenocysteine lyase/cysteine desulfurase
LTVLWNYCKGVAFGDIAAKFLALAMKTMSAMNRELRENLARELAVLHHKHIYGTTQKWEKMQPSERSLWRLLAEKAHEIVAADLDRS